MSESRGFLSAPWTRYAVTLALLAPTLVASGGCSRPAAESTPAAAAAPPAAAATVVPAAEHVAAGAAQVERGRYLVTVGGCNDCHTPWKMGAHGPEPDMTRMLSGHPEQLGMTAPPTAQMPWATSVAATMTAWAGPWGVSFTANLTPDENTGLGIWTQEMFIAAMRTGRHMGQSRPILPPMPWFNYGKMTDEDLAAIFAYLRTIPPIVNHVPAPIPPAASPVPAGG